MEKVAPVAAKAEKDKIKKMCFILSKAGLESVYACFIMANGARMEGIEAEIFFTFFGLDAVHNKRLENLHIATVGNPGMHIPTFLGGLPGMESLASTMMKKEMDKLDIPGVREMLEILDAAGAEIYACQMAMDMFHLEMGDLVPQVDAVITAMDFFDKAAGAQILFI